MSITEEQKRECLAMWNDYEPRIRQLCNRKLQSCPDEIDDTVSETFMILCLAINDGKPINSYPKWLYGVAHNLIKRKYIQVNRDKERLVDIYKCDLKYECDYDDKRLDDEVIEELSQEIVDSLNEDERRLYDYIHHDHLKLREIAEIINTTESAVKQRNYRLHKKVKRQVKEKVDKA